MSSRKKPMVRIVDDDKDLRQTLEYLLQTAGWETVSYESAEDYLAQDARSIPGCLILDVRMGGMSGLDRSSHRANNFFSAHGDIEMAVQAVKNGAEDFLPKTVNSQKLLEKVAEAVASDNQKKGNFLKPQEIVHAFDTLTEKELAVVKLLAKGLLNKEIAERLGITPKTIYGHRVQIYRKLNVHSTAEIAECYQQWKNLRG